MNVTDVSVESFRALCGREPEVYQLYPEILKTEY